MANFDIGPLIGGGKFEEFSDGADGQIRMEWRVDLDAPALEIWAGRPEEGVGEREQHNTLLKLATLTP